MNKRKIMKLIVGIFIFILNFGMATFAEEINYSKSVLVETTKQIKMYSQPDKTSEEITVIKAHTTLVTLTDQEDNWILVKHGDIEGYVEVRNLTLYHAEGIQQEFESKENAYNLMFQEIEYRKQEKHQQLVWGITISLLVVAIFAVGIVSTVLNDKKERNAKKKRCVESKGKSDETDYTDTML